MVTISQQAYRDFSTIAKIGKDILKTLVSDLSADGAHPLVRLSRLRSILENRVDRKEADLLERHLLSLASMSRMRNLDIEQCVNEVTPVIGDNGWTEDDQESWEGVREEITALAGTESISCLEKTMSLAYEHDNILVSASVVTDIRPVFDGDRNSVVASLVTQELRLKYYTNGEHREIGLALDADDVAGLVESCTSALSKGKVAKQMMSDAGTIETLIVGEEE